MATVTDLKRQKKNESRINVYLDGEFFVSADEVALYKAGIKKDSEIDAQDLMDLLRADDSQRAFDFALKYLSYRLRSKKEIFDYLLGKGFDDETIDGVMGKLEHYGYVNDEAFAKMFFASQKGRYGVKKIKYNMRQFGLDDRIIDDVCGGDDMESLKKIADKYRNSHKTCDNKKLATYLLGKGFEWDSVKSVISDEFYD